MSPEKMHSNPPTSIPLTLINPSEKLQQSQKAPFRNYLINESKTMRDRAPTEADQIFVGMSIARVITFQHTEAVTRGVL